MLRALILITTASAWLSTQAKTPLEHVNPLMGTLSSFEFSSGNTYPVTGLPWGMNFWTPMTGEEGDGWQYRYDAHTLRGFKQTHQPSPWIGDYGQFCIMPYTGPEKQREPRSWFSHKAEDAHPDYYRVYLADYDVKAEMTPSERAAVMRFTFPQGQGLVNVDAFQGGRITSWDIEAGRLEGVSVRNSGGVPPGTGFPSYFVIKFDRPLASVDTLNGGSLAMVSFPTTTEHPVTLRVASSFVDADQARQNLKEVSELSFEEARAKAAETWSEKLGRIEIGEDEDPADMATFYTCLYRSLLFPRRLWEVTASGDTLHRSPYDGQVHRGVLYADTGVWDTFRALFPLLNLLYPEEARLMQRGFLNTYRESGFLSEWCSPGHRDCMVGNNSASVMADAWLSGCGVPTEMADMLWEALWHGANATHPSAPSTGRLGYDAYNSLGYVPCDIGINESAARTLEYAYDDWCLLQLAQALGRPKAEVDTLAKRAMNYRNLFDVSVGLMRGRCSDGSFREPFSPFKWGGDFTEGNSWHYTWCVFHDPLGLAQLMGGKEATAQRLDSLLLLPPAYDDSYYGFPIHEIREMTVMDMGQYAHGNQPVQHALYLYDWLGQPWKTQKGVREVMRRCYAPTPDGYCGDEDNGQTSAWFVFSALGMYPVAPCSGQYALGSPLFRKATLTMPSGAVTTLEAPANSEDNVYVSSVRVDGNPTQANYFTREQLQKGVPIELGMSPVPNRERGAEPQDTPYSFTR